MVTTENKAWLAEHDENYRALKAMERRQEWLAFVFEFQKELLLNYRRHLFPDFVIQAPHTPEILTPSDVNRLAREEEEARKRLGLPTPKPPAPPEPEPPAWDADASGFFTRAGITDGAQQDAVNDLVLALKAAGLWGKMRALYPFVGGTAECHRHNLKSASYPIVWQGGVLHDANGITGNNIDAWAATGFDIINTIFGSIAYGVYNKSSTPDASADIKTNVGPEYAIYSRYLNGNFLGISGSYGGHSVQEPNPDAKGFYVVSRESISLYKAYKNGTQFGLEKTNAPDGPLTNDTFLLLGNPTSFCRHNLALAFISDGLTNADVSAFNAAVNVFETALNRSN